jgi:hypothetical protein
MRTVIQEAVRYTAVSACTFCADVAILYVLVRYFAGWYLAAATASFSVGFTVRSAPLNLKEPTTWQPRPRASRIRVSSLDSPL